ncbi:hypothetical protein JHU04_003386 [Brenneria sp. 4F2]|nr:hypothetical protein [Brenneria bubanii]
MLTLFRRILRKGDDRRAVVPTETAIRGHCHESEFCFFNHAATLAFDQIDECMPNAPPRREKSAESMATRHSSV